MKVLIDTHAWLWSLAAPERLSVGARNALVDPGNEVFLSAASAWEIAIKYAIGKLALPAPPAQFVPSRMKAQNIASLAVTHVHALAVAGLPAHHSDPFDRLLIAQAQVEGWPLITGDPQLTPYGVRILW